MTSQGKATREGTARYRDRHSRSCHDEHFSEAIDLTLSSLGLGTYLGDPDDRTDRLVTEATVQTVDRGLNVIDTASNYRFKRGELSVGEALRRLEKEGLAGRDEVLICSKAGFLSYERDSLRSFRRDIVDGLNEGVTMGDLVARCHCMHPAYLRAQLSGSLDNLGVETIDVYYLHNPEIQLPWLSPPHFRQRLIQAFTMLEEACDHGQIQWYGLATWNAFRVPPGHREYLSLEECKGLAKEAAGGGQDRLRFLQLPFNLALTELYDGTQRLGGRTVTTMEAARSLGIHVVASASLIQGQAVGPIPSTLAEALGPDLTDAQRALQFARSAPGVLCALVGMKDPAHVEENMALCAHPPLSAPKMRALLTGTSPNG